MKFVLDNMISPKFAKALREVDRDVHALREICAPGTPDQEVFPRVAELLAALITQDRHIRTRPLERQALSKAGIVTLFLGRFFSKSGFRPWDQFVWLVRHWEGIEGGARSLARGTCMFVAQNGKMHPLP